MTRDHQTRKVSSIKQQSLGLSQAKQRMEQIIQQQGDLTHQWYTFFSISKNCGWKNLIFPKDSGTHVIEAIAALERMLQTHSVQECQVLILHNPDAQ